MNEELRIVLMIVSAAVGLGLFVGAWRGWVRYKEAESMRISKASEKYFDRQDRERGLS